MEITKRKYITTITYDKICNGVKKTCRESYFDKKYVDIRVDEINNCEYDKEYKIDQNTLFLDFIDIYLKKVSLKIDTYEKYESYVSLTYRYIMDYFENTCIKDITPIFIENLSKQVDNQISKFGNKEKVVSKAVKKDITNFLNKLFNYSMMLNLYEINPMKNYKIESQSEEFSIEWSLDTLCNVFELSKGTRFHMFLHCFFGTDLKINEILALKWDDLHISENDLINNNCYAVVNKKINRKSTSYINDNKKMILKVFDKKIGNEGRTRLVIYKITNSKKIHIPINVAKLLIKWKDTLKYLNDLPNIKFMKLKLFSKEKILYNGETMTIRELYYNTLFFDYSKWFEVGYMKEGGIYRSNSISAGTNYRNINLKDIQVPKKKEINILKIISLLKNNPDFSKELTSILK